MIDLHCHLIPNLDDGARDDEQALAMARIAVEDGITTIACTPHMTPGVYDNTSSRIREGVGRLARLLAEARVPLTLVSGADVHVTPTLPSEFQSGQALCLNDTRYALIEPPHDVVPPRMEETFFNLMAAGYAPILTHPERLRWIERSYDLITLLAGRGVLMQITAGSFTGTFGARPLYWAERMAAEGLVHILATDAHNTGRRAPKLRPAYEKACQLLGEAEAKNLVYNRPKGILENLPPSDLPPVPKPIRTQLEGRRAHEGFWVRVKRYLGG